MSMRFMTVCSVCNAPQFTTPSGPTCVNGHGGAKGKLKTFSVPMTKQERQWVDRNQPRCACGHALTLDRSMQGVAQCHRCEQAAEEPQTVTVSRSDLQALLDDASDMYNRSETHHYTDFPEHALRIRAALDE